MTTNNESEIVFDSNSGISEEEQREILSYIDGITERNRLSLSDGTRFKAKKSGGLFPVVVNAAAIAALVGGFFLLSSFQGKADAEVREGAKVYNSAERALIEEIRKETTYRLEAKENEITLINSKLASIDAELHGLYSNNSEWNAEQQAAGDQLKTTQEEYRTALTQLQDQRSQILENARTQETRLQAQLENRTRELALVTQQSAAEIDLARGEMARLSGEQAQAATVEAQMGAFFANLDTQLSQNRFDDASATILAMRNFLNTPAFQSLRSIQSRKELYTQAINSFESLVDAARQNPLAPPLAAEPVTTAPLDGDDVEKTLADLRERNTRLEQNILEKDRTITALSSTGEGAAVRITELEGSVSALRTLNAGLEASSNEKNSQIRTLETQNTALNQTVNARTSTIIKIQDVVQGKAIDDMTVRELSESLERIKEALAPSP